MKGPGRVGADRKASRRASADARCAWRKMDPERRVAFLDWIGDGDTVVSILTSALAWYRDQVYDGAPDSAPDPEWYDWGCEVLGELLAPGQDLRARSEAVERVLDGLTS